VLGESNEGYWIVLNLPCELDHVDAARPEYPLSTQVRLDDNLKRPLEWEMFADGHD
jgi:hypothetical protein